MPQALLRVCLGRPDCPNLVTAGRCPDCARAANQHRGSPSARGYDARWRARRARFLRRYPFCGDRPGGVPPVMSRCREQGLVTAATQVDHVVPHRGNRALFDDEQHNWQSLCATCGARKSQAGL